MYLWLRPLDRTLWYFLHRCGAPTPWPEAAGCFNQWEADQVAFTGVESEWIKWEEFAHIDMGEDAFTLMSSGNESLDEYAVMRARASDLMRRGWKQGMKSALKMVNVGVKLGAKSNKRKTSAIVHVDEAVHALKTELIEMNIVRKEIK
jgi:hypothetical protein